MQEDWAPTKTKLSLTIVSPTAQALNDAQKKGLKLKRAKRGHKPKVKHGCPPSGGRNKLKMELSKHSIAALVSDLASQAWD